MKNKEQQNTEPTQEMVLMTAEDQQKLSEMQSQGTETTPAENETAPEGIPDEEKSIEELVSEVAVEADDKPTSSFSLNRTLGGVIIARMIQRQIWLVLFITMFLIIYINNRYMCQKQTVQIDRLEKQLTQTRYKATVCKSILTEKSRESNIIKALEKKGDSTLTIPTEPPYRIKVSRE